MNICNNLYINKKYKLQLHNNNINNCKLYLSFEVRVKTYIRELQLF